MARPNWSYIRVDTQLLRNRKLDGLERREKLTLIGSLIEAWSDSDEALSDGFVPAARWQKIGTRTTRSQMLERGFAEQVDGGYQMHDYLAHQRSREQIEALSEARRKAGSKGGQAAANRVASAQASAQPSAQASATPGGQQTAKQVLKQPAQAEAVAEAEAGSPQRAASAPKPPRAPPAEEFHAAAASAASQPTRAGRADRPPGARAGDRPAPAKDLCRRCGGKGHRTRDCPTLGDTDEPPRRQGQPQPSGWHPPTGPPPPPKVAKDGAAAARDLLAKRAKAEAGPGDGGRVGEPDDDMPF